MWINISLLIILALGLCQLSYYLYYFIKQVNHYNKIAKNPRILAVDSYQKNINKCKIDFEKKCMTDNDYELYKKKILNIKLP